MGKPRSLLEQRRGTASLNNVLLTMAIVGIFAALDVLGHRETAYFVPKLALALIFSMVCLLLTRDREAFDMFYAVIAAFFSLCAVAMTAGDRANANWWPFFIVFTVAAVAFMLLTRKRNATVLAIGAIVGFRLLVLVALYAFQRS